MEIPGKVDEVVVEAGKWISGWMADVGVGGGASKSLAWMFRILGESVEKERPVTAADFWSAGEGNVEVWRDSFGLLGAAGLADGMTDSIAPATCLRSSEVWGEESLCLAGREVLYESLLWSCERMGNSIIFNERYYGKCGGEEGEEMGKKD